MMMKPILPLGALAMLSACGPLLGQTAPAQPSPYAATAVRRCDARDEARQLDAAADGVIVKVHVRRGDRVKAGQILLEVGCAPRAGLALAAAAGAEQSRAEAALVSAGPRGGSSADWKRDQCSGMRTVLKPRLRISRMSSRAMS